MTWNHPGLELRALAERDIQISALITEIERLHAGIQAYIDGDYGRDQYFKTKHDQCPHGRFGWEPCDNCIDDHFSKLIGLPLAASPQKAPPSPDLKASQRPTVSSETNPLAGKDAK